MIPKGRGDTRGIGLMEHAWKIVESIIDCRLRVVPFHAILHGVTARRGAGTAILNIRVLNDYFQYFLASSHSRRVAADGSADSGRTFPTNWLGYQHSQDQDDHLLSQYSPPQHV